MTVLLGFSKYIFKGFERNNIQITGNWYLDNIEKNVSEIKNQILKHDYKKVNFVGVSKSCTGAFILAGRLAKIMPKHQFNIFAFSAYTTLDESFFEKLSKISNAPGSLIDIWNNPEKKTLALEVGDLKQYLDFYNFKVHLIYPARSRGIEPEMALRFSNYKNVNLIPLEVRIHNILFPFWRKLLPDLKIEMFEGQVKTMPAHAYSYFDKMQKYKNYNFNIYNLIFDTSEFKKEMKIFNLSIPPLIC